MKTERNPNIELWRCFCMIAIVLYHVLCKNPICGTEAFLWHVPGFLIISGYFGVRFKIGKMVRLIFITYLCYWLTLPLQVGPCPLISFLLPHGAWFLPFYCILMVISPLFNAALEMPKNWKPIAISVVLLVLIGWVPTFSTNPHMAMAKVPGMQGNGLMLMLALYVTGFFLRSLQVEKKLQWQMWAACFGAGILGCYGMGIVCPSACHYASPISIFTAVCGFCMFMTMPRLCGSSAKVVNFIAPSMFSVYLIHECCVSRFQHLPAGSGILDAVIRTLMLFVGCVAVDMVRRCIMYGCDGLIDKFRGSTTKG